MTGKTVSLVLGSGGARGLAHIGIIQWLEERGYEIESIAGSSMGALVGGIHAIGELDAYTHWVKALRQIDVLRLLDFSFQKSGLIKGDRVISVLKELTGDRNIEELPISFTAVATNVNDQREVWLNHGSLFDAIRASIAIPTIFTPVKYRGKILVDGGLINPIPIAPTLKDKTDLTVAVDLSAGPDPRCTRAVQESTGSELEDNSYRRRISQFVDSLQQRLVRSHDDEMGVFDVITNAMETMQNTISRFKLASYSPDITISIPRNSCAFYEFYRAEEMIELGHCHAEKVMGAYV
ncbi:MAG: patatin-like phospholipase family protein [Chromatiaceae bacterium]|nr:patatin-like phospholipase family protein [Gammaproteobacteria bacterium]MCB1862226.1 patatin-like phospholipase family protein [Gammaproteobacteria bacterium]MCB1870555.1 patatin-like phospholipase family protein [Gammaproteobacteria bacterium]MCP5448952.1 patatin-like phospholipase family protein [Chromatiaceae bacterium]